MKKLLFAGLLFGCVGLHAQDYGTMIVAPFGTLNNIDSPVTLPDHMAQDMLNVEITNHGAVKKREGYGLAYAMDVTTSSMHGVYHFFDSGGNDVSLFFNDRDMVSEINGNLTTLFKDKTIDATYQCTDSEGYAYCVNSFNDGLFKTDGLTYTSIGPPSTGTMVTSTVERLVMADLTNFPNRIDFSEANDFTNWTPGGEPTSPVRFTIVSPGSRVTHITYAFGRVMWFKSESFGYILEGPTLANWTLRIISHTTGSLINTSVYHNGILYFQGQDSHIYAYDGGSLTKLSLDIAGTIDFAQHRSINAWSQTTQADFEAGTVSTPTWLSTTLYPGSIVLATNTAVADFVDTTSADFLLGTHTGTEREEAGGAGITLDLNIIHNQYNFEDLGDCSCTECMVPLSSQYFQAFLSTTNTIMRGFYAHVGKTGSVGNTTAMLRADNDGLPGDILASASVDMLFWPTFTFESCDDLHNDWELISIGGFSNYTPLVAGTTYWIGFGDSSGGSRAWWTLCNDDVSTCVNPGDGLHYAINGVLQDGNDYKFQYRILGSTYTPSGNYLSQTFDAESDSSTWHWDWDTTTINDTLPSGTTTTYQIQTSTATDGGWEALTSIVSGAKSTSTVSRYIRYKATLESDSATSSPSMEDFTISMTSRIRPGSTFYSPVHKAEKIVSWQKFEADKQDDGGTHVFSIRSHATAFPVLSSTITWASVSGGDVPTVSTAAYFQIKDEFSVTKSTQNPILNSYTLRWYEGLVTDKGYGIYFDDAIWWSVASGAGVINNNYILRLDIVNKGWTLYDIGTNGMYIKSTDLYFGSSDSGYIYQFGGTDNDNGAAINAYWKSKDYSVTSLFVEKEFNKVSVAAGSESGSTITLTYEIDGSSSTAFDIPLADSSSDFIKYNRNLAGGRAGQTINFKVGNNAADQPFEIFGIQFGYRSKPWRPTE